MVSKWQRRLVGGGLGLIAATLIAWGILAARPESPTPFTASHEVTVAVQGNTAFALDLYTKLKEQPGNLFFSPYSISTGLAMTYAGARGQTEREMAGALHFNLPQTNLHAAFGVLTARMNGIQRWHRLTLAAAHSLWCQQDYSFSADYLDLIRTHYGGDARQVNFVGSAPDACRQINEWVERATQGKIKGVVAREQFNEYTRLVLCDAIYFKGKWQHQFKTRDTRPTDFRVSTNRTVTVPMMSQEARFKMTYDGPVEMLELPCCGTDLSLIILMPAWVDGPDPISLADIERDLTPENLRDWLQKLDQSGLGDVWVKLPRFTTAGRFDLTNALASLGMSRAFTTNADFSGLETPSPLHLSDVLHQAFVQVDEAGTEAAAVTLNFGANAASDGRFIADHPFIFLIRENGSGSILFLGRVVDPTEADGRMPG